jgi:hypothetical protein
MHQFEITPKRFANFNQKFSAEGFANFGVKFSAEGFRYFEPEV